MNLGVKANIATHSADKSAAVLDVALRSPIQQCCSTCLFLKACDYSLLVYQHKAAAGSTGEDAASPARDTREAALDAAPDAPGHGQAAGDHSASAASKVCNRTLNATHKGTKAAKCTTQACNQALGALSLAIPPTRSDSVGAQGLGHATRLGCKEDGHQK